MPILTPDMIPIANLPAAIKGVLPSHSIGATVKISATTLLTLALAAAISCNNPAATESQETMPTQAPSPTVEPIVENPNPTEHTPATGRADSGQVATTTPSASPQNLFWRLASPDAGPFDSGDTMSLTLDLDPQNLPISGIQFRLNFPDELLDLFEIEPGAILGADPLVANKSDETRGHILFAMARRGDTVIPTAPGRVATIKLQALQDVSPNRNDIIWLDQVKLTGGDFQTIEHELVTWVLSGPD